MKNLEFYIDVEKSVGKKFLLISISEVKEYMDGKPTDVVKGYKYHCLCMERDKSQLNVTIEGDRKIDLGDGVAYIEFEGLEIKTFKQWDNPGYGISCKAKGIKPVKN